MNSRRDYSSSQISYSKLQNSKFSQTVRQKLENGEESVTDNQNSYSADELMKRMQSSGSVRSNMLLERMQTLQRLRQQTINYLLQMLFGRRTQNSLATTDTSDSTESSDSLQQSFGQPDTSANYTYFYQSEQETTCFDTTGIVRTADGREISFNINLEMSRTFVQETQNLVNYNQPVFCDPLVINLDHNVADVSDQKFLFDLDADGQEESISMLRPGSGYLALDQNGDGKINDGSELFGVQSGNGFSDLAAFDHDHNGWIDEADDIFSRLRIWTKDENGKDTLLSLSEAGVGAICLGSVSTDFSCNSLTDNTTNALIRRTGMFLYENGATGTVQQLDLAT